MVAKSDSIMFMTCDDSPYCGSAQSIPGDCGTMNEKGRESEGPVIV